MIGHTRTRWLVALAAALVLAVCVTVVLLAMAAHPGITLEPANL